MAKMKNNTQFEIGEEKIEKKKSKTFPKDKTDIVLIIVFIALLIFTIILFTKVINKNNEYKDKVGTSIVMPIIEKETKSDLSIDVSNMKKDEEKTYAFKINNYKNDFVIQEEILYQVKIGLPKNIAIEVYKNDQKLTTEKTTDDLLLIKNKLKVSDKQEDIFKIVIKANKDITEKQLININIES